MTEIIPEILPPLPGMEPQSETGIPVTALPGVKVRTYPEMFLQRPPRDKGRAPFKKWPKWSKTARNNFLHFLRLSQNITRSCEAVGLAYSGFQSLRKRNAQFAAAVQEALDAGTNDLEDALMNRSIYGVEKGVYHKGFRVDTEVVYNDAVAFKMLASRNKGTYGAALAIDQQVRVVDTKDADKALQAIRDLKGKVDITGED